MDKTYHKKFQVDSVFGRRIIKGRKSRFSVILVVVVVLVLVLVYSAGSNRRGGVNKRPGWENFLKTHKRVGYQINGGV